MKETIDSINKGLENIFNFVISFLTVFLAGLGFIFGGIALLFIFIEKGADTYIIEFSFKMVGIFLSIIIVLIVLKFYFWLIQRYVVPRLEKKRDERNEERKKELIKIIRDSVRKELKDKRKK